MKHIKRIAAAVLALCALLALTACGGVQEKGESKLGGAANLRLTNLIKCAY